MAQVHIFTGQNIGSNQAVDGLDFLSFVVGSTEHIYAVSLVVEDDFTGEVVQEKKISNYCAKHNVSREDIEVKIYE